jgi:hypothetical protein
VIASCRPDAKGIGDKGVELVAGLIVLARIDQTQVDRRVPAIGDDREEDIVARFRRAVALFDRGDPLVEQALIGLEGGRRLGRDDLALAAGDRRHSHVVAQVLRQHDVREGAEHGDQLGHVDELGEARDWAVFAGRLHLELGRGIAEGRGPGVELVEAALFERGAIHQALHGEHLAERVGDRRARGEHERAARVLGLDEAGLHVEVPGPLRAVRIDAAQARHVGGEGEFSELLRLVDDDLVDADLRDRQQIVLA